MSISRKLTTIAENQQRVYDAGYAKGQAEGGSGSYDEGYEAGQQAEYDRFWDAFQLNGERVSYDSAFMYDYWKDVIYNPKYPLKFEGQNGGRQAFFQSLLTSIRVPIYAKNTRLRFTFGNSSKLKTIPLLHIEGVTEFSDTFLNCSALQNIIFDGTIADSISFAQSNLLTEASVQSIIDHLKDFTGDTERTLTFHADVGAKLTDAQKATITAKNWQLVY